MRIGYYDPWMAIVTPLDAIVVKGPTFVALTPEQHAMLYSHCES